MSKDDDKFEDLFGTARPIKHDKVTIKKSTKTQRSKPELDDEDSDFEFTPQQDKDIQSSDTLFYAKSGLQNKVIKKLKQGKFIIENTVDLHGLTKAQAKKVLLDFITNHNRPHVSCVLIIHGKGENSQKLPVLKNLTYHLLQQHPKVLALTSAKPHDGGLGAVYVLLKSSIP